ncbi:hypothetical protein J4727_06215 [Providencia rettgeri]|uniref:Uncharacterized protein n=1 Tax=Providencia rettgeri TaxID=587 RepID=A0A939SP11_PRORE|nr:hypothetical protein [Providencia rettgeri]
MLLAKPVKHKHVLTAEKLANTPVEPTDIEATDDLAKPLSCHCTSEGQKPQSAICNWSQLLKRPLTLRLTRKAAVAAAIARAKAKKAAQEQPALEPVADTVTDAEVDPRKAAVCRHCTSESQKRLKKATCN